MALFRDREAVKVDNAQGGEGYIVRDLLLQGDNIHGELTYVSTITLDPGCSIGIHQHTDDNEMYFVYEGSGTYTDNGETYPVGAGDVVFCAKGGTHGIENTGDVPMHFVALMQA